MSGAEEDRKRAARAEQVALFRYQLIRQAADPALSTRQRGRLVRELAAAAHPGPFGDPVTVSRETIDRWIRAWRAGGFAALAPPARQVTPRTDAAVLELAAGLKREKPGRTAAQVMRILRASCGWSPPVRTLQRHFERLELTTRPDGRPPAAFGRFEASRPNELWTGDALHGPRIAGRKAYLFAFLDDHSRAVMAARWGYFEDTVRLAAALRPALAARGVPDAIYVDNGSAFVDAALKRAAARLGIKITHSQPGRPSGPRQDRTVFRGRAAGVPGRDRRRGRHRGPGAAEQAVHRLVRNGLPRPAARGNRAAAHRAVASRGPVPRAVAGPAARGVLVGRVAGRRQDRHDQAVRRGLRDRPGAGRPRVECVFDPFDLAVIEVRWNGRPYGLAKPQHIGRHSHPKAKPETPAAPPPGTGIDYLGVIAAEHDAAARRHRIRYDALARNDDQDQRRRAGGPVTGRPAAARPAQISQILSWCARLTAAGSAPAPPRSPPA